MTAITLSSAYTLPILDADTEYDLAHKYQQDSDLDAAQQLVLGNLRFVAFIARQYRNYGLPEQDILQEGAIGLMKAVKRFNPQRGVRLISFAVHWIRAEIHEYIIKNWRIVKIATTKAQRKLFFKLRSATDDGQTLNKADTQLLANQFGVKESDIVTMHMRLHSPDISLTPPTDSDNNSSPLLQLPASEESDPAVKYEQETNEILMHETMHTAIACLDARSQDIIKARWLSAPKKTLSDLADQYNISIERVRQIEQKAFDKIRPALEKLELLS